MSDKVAAAKIELGYEMTKTLATSLARIGMLPIPAAEKQAMREKILAGRRALHAKYQLRSGALVKGLK